MKHFRKLAENLDFSLVLMEVLNNLELFKASEFRQNFKGSPFTSTRFIPCRLTFEQDIDPEATEKEMLIYRARKGVTNINAVDTENYSKLPLVYEAVMNLASVLQAEQIGRVLVAELFAGGEINRHYDYGPYHDYYDRFHIVIGGNGCYFRCEDEVVKMMPGEVWTFNNRGLHEVFNDSDDSRFHIVIDMKLKGDRISRWPDTATNNNLEFLEV